MFDGTRTSCDPQKQPGAVVKGILSPSQMPLQIRKDFGSNMNDSYWLSNPAAPLAAGFAPIIGDEGTARALRTRNGLVQIERQLAGGGKFDLARVQQFITNNRNYSAELLLPDGHVLPGESGHRRRERRPGLLDPGRMGQDREHRLDRCAALARGHERDALANRYTVPFDVNDPVHTPRGLNTSNPAIVGALADAVTYMTDRSVPLTSTWRTNQYTTKNGENIPIPGGPGGHGVFNVITAIETGPLRHPPATPPGSTVRIRRG